MALDAPAVEDPALSSMSAGRRGSLGALLALHLWGGVAATQDLAAYLQPYRAAGGRGQVGVLTGAAFLEPRKPQGAVTALAGVAIVVLPPAPSLVAELEGVKARIRDSAARYLAAAGEVRKIQEAYEGALSQAGAAALVFTAVTDQEGRFALSRVPAGEWMLLARHELLHAKPPRRIPRGEARGVFLLELLPSGYRAVTYWLMPLTVEEGGEVRVELHDRNSWLTGVAEEKTQGVIKKTTP